MLRFWKTSPSTGRRLGILSGAFNPPTVAHLEVARAGVRQYSLDEVLFFLPLVFPHKAYGGASFEQRREMLAAALEAEPRFSIASSEDGLLVEIARACRTVYGPEVEILFLCGSDAAARFASWDYGAGPPFVEQLREFQLLVAPRGGPWEPAAGMHALEVPPEVEIISSSAVREAIADGRDWEPMVPPPVAAIIRRDGLY